MVVEVSVRGLEISLLAPVHSAAHEVISRACIGGRIVALITVDSSCVAGFAVSAHYHRLTLDGYRRSEDVEGVRVGCFNISLVAPDHSAAHEDINRSGAGHRVVNLIAVDAGGVAGLTRRSYDYCVAGNSD